MRILPRTSSTWSRTRATSMVTTTPVATSAPAPSFWKPSVRSSPRLRTPSTPPTVTRETVETVTTRRAARRAGPARGSSTPRKRWGPVMPWARAASSTWRSTAAKASVAAGTRRARPYRLRATTTFRSLRIVVPMSEGRMTNSAREGTAYSREAAPTSSARRGLTPTARRARGRDRSAVAASAGRARTRWAYSRETTRSRLRSTQVTGGSPGSRYRGLLARRARHPPRQGPARHPPHRPPPALRGRSRPRP